MKTQLKGIVPPIVTPLTEQDRLDVQGVERLIKHVLDGGVHGIFVLGTTGEAQSLSYATRYEMVRLVCEITAGKVPVLVGISDTSLDESLKLAAWAKSCGAEAVVSAPPYYFAPSQQELIEYYTALADALPLPLYLYNMPSHVKVIFEPKTVQYLAQHPNIVGLKDSSGNMVYFQTLLHCVPEGFSLFVGPEELTAECVMMGASGGVNGGANLFPRLYVDLYEAALAHNTTRISELQKIVMDISTGIYTIGKYGSSYLKGVKCSLSIMGICDDYLSYPYQRFKQEERDKVKAILESLSKEYVKL